MSRSYGPGGDQIRSCAPEPSPAATPHGGVTTALGAQERAVLRILVEQGGRVISRHELARRCGLTELHERRCDSILVHVRQALGPDSIVTVRRRGWMLQPDAVERAVALLGERPATEPSTGTATTDDVDGELSA
jgi:DNA-binding winged helix-turn-helix (wHTH) protein